ncbi:hypothetical protein CDL12_13983 [Handroanthus impetiginosus]|uniref:Uncharacterized protein n=1 Tax=Handroanthus impetiginosus TaxID=429701 RepID=A0A2G9H7A4_9LAMI|nr:hypothetical protein CDL12_13983 [Handroanthus impetiginosus]
MTNPTTEKSPKAESKGAVKYQELIQQFKNLEREWESLEKSRPRKPRTYSTFSSDSSSNVTSFDHLLGNSPRLLMSSLQHSNMFKKCDIAVEEILRDRRAAIISGKLKGRRLFWAAEEEPDSDYGAAPRGDGEICGDNWVNNVIQEREVIVDKYCGAETSSGGDNESFSFSDSSPSEEKVVMEEKTTLEVVEQRGGGGGWRLPMAWFAFVLIALITGVVCITCNGRSVHENEFHLVPT